MTTETPKPEKPRPLPAARAGRLGRSLAALAGKGPAAPGDGARPAGDDAAAAETGEIGGPEGPDPTRYGDWERKGRCIDF